jgi:hypothetical protein
MTAAHPVLKTTSTHTGRATTETISARAWEAGAALAKHMPVAASRATTHEAHHPNVATGRAHDLEEAVGHVTARRLHAAAATRVREVQTESTDTYLEAVLLELPLPRLPRELPRPLPQSLRRVHRRASVRTVATANEMIAALVSVTIAATATGATGLASTIAGMVAGQAGVIASTNPIDTYLAVASAETTSLLRRRPRRGVVVVIGIVIGIGEGEGVRRGAGVVLGGAEGGSSQFEESV